MVAAKRSVCTVCTCTCVRVYMVYVYVCTWCTYIWWAVHV